MKDSKLGLFEVIIILTLVAFIGIFIYSVFQAH